MLFKYLDLFIYLYNLDHPPSKDIPLSMQIAIRHAEHQEELPSLGLQLLS